VEIQRQSEQYGLPERTAAELPTEEHVAGLLGAPSIPSGSIRLDEHE
jgi:hypothetical protein